MLLLVVQYKLFHLNGEVIVDLAVELCMFTRSLIIKKRVEDVQLGEESYQKNPNITKPQNDFPGISAKELLRNFRLGYNKDMPRRKWSYSDKRRSGIMKDLIDQQMQERQILRNLERLVGARELEMDYRLMQRIVLFCHTWSSFITDSHHGPNDAVHNPPQPLKNIRMILHSIHNDDGNPSRDNIKQAL
ncbi:hypothetical protein Tco_1463881, partial [Tanacetum coccineum]